MPNGPAALASRSEWWDTRVTLKSSLSALASVRKLNTCAADPLLTDSVANVIRISGMSFQVRWPRSGPRLTLTGDRPRVTTSPPGVQVPEPQDRVDGEPG